MLNTRPLKNEKVLGKKCQVLKEALKESAEVAAHKRALKERPLREHLRRGPQGGR